MAISGLVGRSQAKGKEHMNQQEVLRLAKSMGVLISSKQEFQASVKRFGSQIVKRFKPLSKTQQMYLDALTEPKSLQDLADQFGCTPQNALKMMRALEARNLVTKQQRFKRRLDKGAWAWYYERNV